MPVNESTRVVGDGPAVSHIHSSMESCLALEGRLNAILSKLEQSRWKQMPGYARLLRLVKKEFKSLEKVCGSGSCCSFTIVLTTVLVEERRNDPESTHLWQCWLFRIVTSSMRIVT